MTPIMCEHGRQDAYPTPEHITQRPTVLDKNNHASRQCTEGEIPRHLLANAHRARGGGELTSWEPKRITSKGSNEVKSLGLAFCSAEPPVAALLARVRRHDRSRLSGKPIKHKFAPHPSEIQPALSMSAKRTIYFRG